MWEARPSLNSPRVRLVLLALGTACLLGVSIPMAASGDDATPTWKLTHYYSRGGDRSFKLDVAEELPKVPRAVVFGGSRAMRMDPATIRRQTGLAAFNFAFHNGHPEDAWAVTDWLLERNPDQPPAVIWCLQATTLADVPMAPGLIVDKRLAQTFPASLIAAKKADAMRRPKRDLLSGRRFGRDGMLWWNSYDRKRAAGRTLRRSLSVYLSAKMLARAGNGKIPGRTRAKAYFSRTLLLLNRNHIRPLIVIMPYHPTARKAFMKVGWGVKQRHLRNYLKRLQRYRDFRVVNCLDIKTFGGSPNGFYDGAHLTAGNSRRLIRYLVRKAPGCFRVPAPAPAPVPSETAGPASPAGPSASPSPSPALVAPPADTPVPEDTSTPADFLE